MKNHNKIALEILNAKSRVEKRREYKDFCDTCNHNSCKKCDGRNEYKQAVG